MTPNRADAPAMKGKRLRSLLEEHKKSGRATFSFENSLMILIIICTYVLFNFFKRKKLHVFKNSILSMMLYHQSIDAVITIINE